MIERRTFLASGASALALSAAGARAEVKTGGARLIPIGGGHNVWTKRVGRSRTKVLLLHGGPGFSHDYLECFEDFLPRAGIEFYYYYYYYYYDQLGCDQDAYFAALIPFLKGQ